MGSISRLILILTFTLPFSAYSAKAKNNAKKEVVEEKVYTQKEFDEKLKKTVDRQIDLIKKNSIAELAKEMSDKSLTLEKKEEDLKRREELLVAQRDDFMKKVDRFEQMKSGIIGCIEKNEEQKNSRISKVVEVISNMKPVKAAEILQVQDSDISVNILSKLDPTKASKIFNLMDKEISARLQKQYLHMKK